MTGSQRVTDHQGQVTLKNLGYNTDINTGPKSTLSCFYRNHGVGSGRILTGEKGRQKATLTKKYYKYAGHNHSPTIHQLSIFQR